MNQFSERPKANYRCSQAAFYAICNIAWENYGLHTSDFTNFNTDYTALYGTDRLAELEAAKALPGFQQRNSVTEALHNQMVAVQGSTIITWKKLGSHIERSFAVEFHKPYKEAAGSDRLDGAVHRDWEELDLMMTEGKLFMDANAAALTAGGMPAAYVTEYDAAMNVFHDLYVDFVQAETDNKTATDVKIIANNALFDKTTAMLNDAELIYAQNAAMREMFDWDYLLELVEGSGNGGGGEGELTFSGTVTDNVTGEALADAELIVDGEVIATTNAAGQFSKTFTITEVLTIQLVIKKPEYKDYVSSVQFSPGVDLTQNVQMAAKVGSISGTASDLGTALGIGGTSITLTNGSTVINIAADANGNYSKGGVRVGMYTATATAPGYIGQSVTVIINEDVNTVQNFSLVVVP